MNHLFVEIKSVRVKSFFAMLFGLWVTSQVCTYLLLETYEFDKISKHSITHQKTCLSQFLEVMKQHKIPLILFDIEILPELFQARPKSWHNSKHECKTLCKFHPEEKSLISFAIEGSKFVPVERQIVSSLKKAGFVEHVTNARDPRLLAANATTWFIPTYMWLAKQNHVIHVTILYERADSYIWAGPVTKNNWKHTVNALASELTDGWHSMERIAAKFPVYEQAFEKSHRFLALPLDIDGHRVNVPYHIQGFLKEYRESHYIECNHAQARQYRRDFELFLPEHEVNFKSRAKAAISKAKKILDDLDIPFWLNGATLLGWFRQCDIIGHSQNVNFGIRASDYSEELVKRFEQDEFLLLKKFGHPLDSFELRFLGYDGVYVEVYAFYEEKNTLWSGGTQARDGRRYKFVYPKSDLCWSELLQMKIRVPCQARDYIEAAFGVDWMVPRKDWIWNLHPPNVETNGKWHSSEWRSMMQHFRETPENKAEFEEETLSERKYKDVVEASLTFKDTPAKDSGNVNKQVSEKDKHEKNIADTLI